MLDLFSMSGCPGRKREMIGGGRKGALSGRGNKCLGRHEKEANNSVYAAAWAGGGIQVSRYNRLYK